MTIPNNTPGERRGPQSVQWAGRAGEHISAPTSVSSLPEVNNSCPECGGGIPDGSAWRLDPDAKIPTRLHTGCLDKLKARRRQGAPEVISSALFETPPAEPILNGTPLSELQAQVVRPYLVGARNQVNKAAAAANNDTAILHLSAAISSILTHLENM
ncbi:hypothetical protein SEA_PHRAPPUCCINO_149 [Mycobacterium phage Phrappuccino]|uniref:Uncharacterized protein n=1 Tax=Mycobacterium phage Phrappuccino TaxID=2591223 RepID=A0A514DDY8_9CAUD|nr:hypothetical protein KHQ87_gp149 [Mycobacterium phage Phrappuccino]QDH91824.1 hypothetical protein SEA_PHRAPPUCCINO_149 [Mycobacterium phage Phrappuccino]QIQ63266.1 hypothetical protein SEA_SETTECANDELA_149 [Mycobacterium phage Settecandela]